MDTPYRQYIQDDDLESFRVGFDEALGYKQHVQVIRLSLRSIHRNTVVAALVGLKGKPGGRTFELPLPKDELTARRWTALGAEVGRAVEGWLAPRFQDPLQAQAALGKSVWERSPLEELAGDAVDNWEATWRAHLSGHLHPRAKAALVAMLADELTRVAAEVPAEPATEDAPPPRNPPLRVREPKTKVNSNTHKLGSA